MLLILLALLLLAVPGLVFLLPSNKGDESHEPGSPSSLFKRPLFWLDVARFLFGFYLLFREFGKEANWLEISKILGNQNLDFSQENIIYFLFALPPLLLIPHLLIKRNKRSLVAPLAYCFGLAIMAVDLTVGILSILVACTLSLIQADFRWILPVLAVVFTIGTYLVNGFSLGLISALAVFAAPTLLAAFSLRKLRIQ